MMINVISCGFTTMRKSSNPLDKGTRSAVIVSMASRKLTISLPLDNSR
jgi:hypothetical protein